jgi:HEPN domain-containing protein
MTPSEARARESREWLTKADQDLASARVLIGSGHIANALFFCQQAAEKSLKAFLTWHQQAFRRTHDLEELGEACRAIDGTLAGLLEQADALSDYAWNLRYPGSTLPNRRKRRPCSALPAAFSPKSSRGSIMTAYEPQPE